MLLSSSAPNLLDARIRERLFKERVLQMRAMRRERLSPMKEESVRVERKKKVTSEALEAAKWGVTSLEGRKY